MGADGPEVGSSDTGLDLPFEVPGDLPADPAPDEQTDIHPMDVTDAVVLPADNPPDIPDLTDIFADAPGEVHG